MALGDWIDRILQENYLAPIENHTNLPFRLLVSSHGARATIAPLVSASAICRNRSYLEKLDMHESEKFLGVQLVGSVPEEFGIAAKAIEHELGFVKWIDINSGCPSSKTVGTGCGAALLDHPDKIREIIRQAGKSGLPISIKMRLADSMARTMKFVDACSGADFITVHGRTRAQGYSGSADWEAIKKIKQHSGTPVVGNGDIKTLEEGKLFVRDGFCDSFMAGRAALSNPLLFEGGKAETKEEKKLLFSEYVRLARQHGALSLSDLKLKAFELFRGERNSARFRDALAHSATLEEIIEKTDSF